MPIVTATQWLLLVLDQMPLPGNGGQLLQAFIAPPNPEEDELDPHAYIWPSSGAESRQSVPRAAAPGLGVTQSGWKDELHHVDVFLTWFQDGDHDPNPDITYLSVVDAVMASLRTVADPVLLSDPVTGQLSQISGTGERMNYDIATPKGTDADQRLLRYDSRIVVRLMDSFQS